MYSVRGCCLNFPLIAYSWIDRIRTTHSRRYDRCRNGIAVILSAKTRVDEPRRKKLNGHFSRRRGNWIPLYFCKRHSSLVFFSTCSSIRLLHVLYNPVQQISCSACRSFFARCVLSCRWRSRASSSRLLNWVGCRILFRVLAFLGTSHLVA